MGTPVLPRRCGARAHLPVKEWVACARGWALMPACVRWQRRRRVGCHPAKLRCSLPPRLFGQLGSPSFCCPPSTCHSRRARGARSLWLPRCWSPADDASQPACSVHAACVLLDTLADSKYLYNHHLHVRSCKPHYYMLKTHMSRSHVADGRFDSYVGLWTRTCFTSQVLLFVAMYKLC